MNEWMNEWMNVTIIKAQYFFLNKNALKELFKLRLIYQKIDELPFYI